MRPALPCRCWREQEDEIIDDCTCMVAYLSPAATISPSNSSSGGTGISNKVQAAVSSAAAALAAKLDSGLRIGSHPGPAAAAGASEGSGARNVAAPHNIIARASVGSSGLHPGTLGYKHSK